MPSKRKTSEAADTPSETASASNLKAPKRRRVSRACDQCRAAREKCDGIQPLCFPCVSQNRSCTYDINPKKRGVQTGYIRTLELALAWVFEKVPGGEDALSTLLTHEGGRGQTLLSGKETSQGSRLYRRWQKSKVHKEIERVLSGGDSGETHRSDKSSPSEESSDTDGDSETARQAHLDTPSVNSQAHHSTRLDHPHPFPNIYRNAQQAPTRLKLPINHWRLLDVYFSYTHSWFPILEKQDLFQASYLYSDNGVYIVPGDASYAIHAELWSALALAAFQDAASARLKPDQTQEQPETLSPEEIYEIARSMIPLEHGPFQIHHTRSLLLLALINLGRERLTTAWILVGLAIRIGLDVGMDQQTDQGRNQQRMQTVFIASFILDTITAARCNKTPHLKAEDLVTGLSISENDLDEWQPWMPCEGFGTSGSSALSSRSPAYSLSAFNQAYEIVKVVAHHLGLQRRAMASTADAYTELQQAVSSRLPFGTFVVSKDSSSATIPSAYVIKLLFLWATALTDFSAELSFLNVMETLEQYLSHFGSCGAPPIFLPCLAMMAEHPGFASLRQHDKNNLEVLRLAFASTWEPSKANRPTSAPSNHFQSPETARESRPEPSSIPEAVLSSVDSGAFSVPTAASLYGHSPLPPEPSSATTAVYPSLDTSYFLPPYHPITKQLMSPSASHMAGSGGQMGGTPDLLTSPLGAPLQHQQLPLHRTSFSGPGPPLDYDALLEDLTSTDYADRLDADPQFMANLGFAPGCDLSEILTRDFATL